MRPPTLRPVMLEDRGSFEARLAAHPLPGDPLAAYSFPYHVIWQDLFRYEWMELEGHDCLLASDQEGSFLALPPIGPDPCGQAMAQAFAFLSERNKTPAMTRIENAPEVLAERCRERGYQVKHKESDYVYRRADLLGLHGDRYKSQRVAYNHCVKESRPVFRAYRPENEKTCLALFRQWREGVKQDGASDLARHLAADAESAHRQGISHAAELGLVGASSKWKDGSRPIPSGIPSPQPSPREGEGRVRGQHSASCSKSLTEP
ncbi:MAG TPA: phosphatidylglycerol lysyltransferase domain-containing protein [Nitrospirales bacterium]|nr:phosphatidylglycerol lysyltransferase domain-containing protein [Nitrospirales bacterium]